MENWLKVGSKRKCIVVGDMNLDFLRWNQPDQFHEDMVETTHNRVETAGFVQLIKEKNQNMERTSRLMFGSCVDQLQQQNNQSFQHI